MLLKKVIISDFIFNIHVFGVKEESKSVGEQKKTSDRSYMFPFVEGY